MLPQCFFLLSMKKLQNFFCGQCLLMKILFYSIINISARKEGPKELSNPKIKFLQSENLIKGYQNLKIKFCYPCNSLGWLGITLNSIITLRKFHLNLCFHAQNQRLKKKIISLQIIKKCCVFFSLFDIFMQKPKVNQSSLALTAKAFCIQQKIRL